MKRAHSLTAFCVDGLPGRMQSQSCQEGAAAAPAWLDETGRQNIEDLNQVLRQTAVSWLDKLDLPFEDRTWQVRDF